MIKKARKEFEKKLAKDIKADRKSFFAYARSKCKSKVKVGLIEDSQGKLQEDSRVKAELLNDFFSSVFTREDDSDIPVQNPMCEVKLQDIDVHVDIIKKLTILKEDKAAGDDSLSPRILKGISDEVAPTSKQYWLNIGTMLTYWVKIGRYHNILPILAQYCNLSATQCNCARCAVHVRQYWPTLAQDCTYIIRRNACH